MATPTSYVIDRVPGLGERAAGLRQEVVDARTAARADTGEHGADRPDISGWSWPTGGPS